MPSLLAVLRLAVQEDDDPYVRVVAGSVSNVIGLPMESLEKMLERACRAA